MKKRFLITALAMGLIFSAIIATAELLNITTAGVDGNWVIYDASKNIICTFDAANRKLSFPSGATVDYESGAVVKLAGTTITPSGVRHYTVGTTSVSANTNLNTTGLIYSGAVTVTSGTNVVVTGLSPAFTGTATYQCVVTPAAPNPDTGVAWKVAKTSTSSITISTTTTAAVTDTISYMCMGY